MENSFEKWKAENPNGNLNDFYRTVGRVATNQSYKPNFQSDFDLSQKNITETSKPNYIGLAIGIVGFISYFLPWFKIPIFNLSVSGNEILQLSSFFRNQITASDISLLKYCFVIPASYGAILLGTIVKNFWTVSIGTVASLLSVGFITLKIYFDIPDLLPYMDVGLYLLILSSITSFINLFVIK